jgi:hypothetical protein
LQFKYSIKVIYQWIKKFLRNHYYNFVYILNWINDWFEKINKISLNIVSNSSNTRNIYETKVPKAFWLIIIFLLRWVHHLYFLTTYFIWLKNSVIFHLQILLIDKPLLSTDETPVYKNVLRNYLTYLYKEMLSGAKCLLWCTR